jgi:hypothetical protein
VAGWRTYLTAVWGRLFPYGAYGRLLLLVLACVLVPLATPDDLGGLLATLTVQAVTLVAAASITRATARVQSLARVAGLAVLLVVIAALVTPVRAPEFAVDVGLVFALFLAATAPLLIVRDVARHEAISLKTVAAALAVYLLLGLAFAYVHVIFDGRGLALYSQALSQSDGIYLSFITLTTVGFGDVTPVDDVARALIIGEAILGQIYLVSVVALLVGNIGRRREPRARGVTGA